MAQFAIASLAAMADLNPLQPLPGMLPELGYQISVHWDFLIAFAAGVAGVHALILALTLWISRSVVVCDDSYLVAALLLHGLVGLLEGVENLTNAKYMAQVLQRRLNEMDREGATVRYGLRDPGAEERPVLEIGTDSYANGRELLTRLRRRNL